MITLEDYYGKWAKERSQELSDAHRQSAAVTVARANAILATFGDEREINSGWRPASYNATVSGAAKNSKHILCQAIDLRDTEGDLDQYLYDDWLKWKEGGKEDECILAKNKLWMEHPASTKGWCHLQIVPPKSGNRVFYP